MNIIFLLIAASTVVALIFLASFIWAVRTGQFDDDRAPAIRILDGPGRSKEDMNERKDR
ncbi:MAG: cbb3-type cytochrome oxidase assembly protein CcoS [Flavobacteriales bacterium]|nr:cbb3-type cytochrome oxidase assembly protein CcoS [Flavobacteriales bacterium]